MISIIAAYAHNRVIGNKGRIPWHLRKDQLHFKQLTLGSVLIMGRRSFMEILAKFGRGLPERETIVLSRTQQLKGENYCTAGSLQEALDYAKSHFPEKDIFICGGESVYREAMEKNIAEKLYLTEIELEVEGDAFFPEFEKSEYTLEEEKLIDGELPYRLITFRK